MEVKKTYAAIMFSDIVGYTAMMGRNEEMAYQLVKRNVRLHQEIIKKYHGKLVKEMGDGVLSSYPSGREAIAAALELQQHYFKSKEISLRIGVHFGEIIEDENDVFGDAVNIASRLQTLGHPNSVLFSNGIREDINGLGEYPHIDLGKFDLKNVADKLHVFALANEGLAVPKRGDLLKLLESRVRKVMVLLLAVVSTSLVFVIFKNLNQNQPAPIGVKTIAILELVPIEEDIDGKRMSMELRQELISRLSSVDNITVISEASSDFPIQAESDRSLISKRLGANFLVYGDFHTGTDSVFLKISLYDNMAKSNTWEQQFALPKEEYFSLHPLVSNLLISDLGVEISEAKKKQINRWNQRNMDAFELYLKGRDYYKKYDSEENEMAFEHFEMALKLDTEYELAWAGLADCYSFRFFSDKSKDYWLDSAEHCANRALSLHPDLAEGYNALSTIYGYKGEFKKSGEYLEKAILLRPSYPQAVGNYATNHFSAGNLPEALFWQKRAAGLSPDNYIPRQLVGWTLRRLRRFDEAIEWLESSLERKADRETYEQLGLCHLELGRLDDVRKCIKSLLTLTDSSRYTGILERSQVRALAAGNLESAGILSLFIGEIDMARAYFSQAMSMNPDLMKDVWSFTPVYLGFLKLQEGEKMEGRLLLDAARHLHEHELLNETDDFEHYFYLAMIQSSKGSEGEALSLLQICLENNQFDYSKIKFNPVFSGLTESENFMRIVREYEREVESMNQLLESKNLSTLQE